MPDLNNIIMFLTASILLALAPGPDNIFVLTQSITNGRAAGVIITLGLCTGLIVHTTIVALGISVIFQTSVIAFNILKYLGVAYLLYLSWNAFKSSTGEIQVNQNRKLSSLQLYRRGIIMNVTNPKVSIFFMAFLPQFTNPGKGSLTLQLITLGSIFIIVTFFVFGSISQVSGFIGSWIMRSEKGQKYLNRIAGVIYASIAVKLFLTSQK